MSDGTHKKKKHGAQPPASVSFRRKRTALIVLCCILAVVLLVLVAATCAVEGLLGKIRRIDGSQPTLSSDEIHNIENPTETRGDLETRDPSDITWNSSDLPHIGGDGIVNLLLIGQDRREGQGRARSDSMILCTFNTKRKTLTMTSFMRDLYVEIPDYQDNRINAAYALGGMELLDATLMQNFGIEVDGNVEVDFGEFEQIIDLLGGVDIDLNADEAEYLSRRGNWDVSDTAYSWDLVEGTNHLTGEQALAYSRIRYIGRDDFERTSRQRRVLSALIDAYKNVDQAKMLSILNQVLPMISTDLTNKEILGYAVDLWPLTQYTVVTQRIPADDAYEGVYIRGMAVLVPDLEANRKLLVDSLG